MDNKSKRKGENLAGLINTILDNVKSSAELSRNQLASSKKNILKLKNNINANKKKLKECVDKNESNTLERTIFDGYRMLLVEYEQMMTFYCEVEAYNIAETYRDNHLKSS